MSARAAAVEVESEPHFPDSTTDAPLVYGNPPVVQRTTYRRTNNARFVIRVVELTFPDARIVRGSYLIDTASGRDASRLHLVSYDGGARCSSPVSDPSTGSVAPLPRGAE